MLVIVWRVCGRKTEPKLVLFYCVGPSSQDRGRERLQQPCPASSFLHLGWALLADQHHVAAVRRKLGGGCIRAFGDEFFESN